MAARDFLLPDLGEGLTEGQVVRWLVAVGDAVSVDQPLAEIETEKAVVEIPSPLAGIVTTLHAEVGDEVEVGKPLVTLTDDSDEAPGSDGDTPDNGSGALLVGYGTNDAGRRPRRRERADDGPSAPPHLPGRPLAKPPVRKLAKDLGVDLAAIEGSGPGGTITREDVRGAAGQVTTAGVGDGHGGAGATERIPLRGVRKRIADRMTTSRREIPEATTWVDCDATRLMELRAELNASSEVRVSPLAIILRACVAGLKEHPELNARLDADAGEIVLQEAVHLGVAVHTERGLVVPVIRDAHRRSTLEIAAELARLAAGARDGSLQPGELQGSTFTVSNYGAFGVDGGNPVINHPNAAILGTGRISARPWVVDGVVAARQVMQLAVAFDHRICDGGEAAGFLRFVADCVERPARLLAVL